MPKSRVCRMTRVVNTCQMPLSSSQQTVELLDVIPLGIDLSRMELQSVQIGLCLMISLPCSLNQGYQLHSGGKHSLLRSISGIGFLRPLSRELHPLRPGSSENQMSHICVF